MSAKSDMENRRTVQIIVLREVLNRILTFVEDDLGRREMLLAENSYWAIGENDRYSMEIQPQQLECGSLIDDWEFVRSAFDDPGQAIPLTLMHVAPILQALATALPSYPPQSKGPM